MGRVTYYFNAKSTDEWANSENMIDGNEDGTYAFTGPSKDETDRLTGNTCPGTNLGGITKVEVRTKAFSTSTGTSAHIELQAIYSGGDGDLEAQYEPTIDAVPVWDSYIDITTGTNAPSSWTWTDVVNLDLDIRGITISRMLSCSMIQIRVTYGLVGDLNIYYDSLTGDDCIPCWCTRWDVQNYNVIIETFMYKNEIQTIQDNTTPGAVGQLYKILGKPKMYDSTWTNDNTLLLSPNVNSNSNLKNMRSDTVVYVKNMTTSPLPGDKRFINLKIEAVTSSSTL